MAADPQLEHGIHGRLRRGSEHEFHIELIQAAAGDPEDIALEPLDVLRLLLELRLRDEDGKVHLAMAGRIELLPDRLVDQLHDRPAVRPPDVHPLDWVALVAELRAVDDAVIPLAELLVLPPGMTGPRNDGDNMVTVAAHFLP